MRVSIVTISYNQAAYLEHTMLSVLNQTYPDIEYIVIDGGSTDGSQEIIRKYESRLAYSHSKRDHGSADGLNQGISRTTGEVVSYLNSDDLLAPGAAQTIVNEFTNHSDADVVYGDSMEIDEHGNEVRVIPSEPFDIAKIFTTWENPVRQPSAFFKRNVWERYTGMDQNFPFCYDFEYWIRISPGVKFRYVPSLLSSSRLHSQSRSIARQDLQAQDMVAMFEQYRTTPIFLSSGVTENEARKGLCRVAGEHYLTAGKKWSAFKTHIEYTKYAFKGIERLYRILRYIARLLLKS